MATKGVSRALDRATADLSSLFSSPSAARRALRKLPSASSVKVRCAALARLPRRRLVSAALDLLALHRHIQTTLEQVSCYGSFLVTIDSEDEHGYSLWNTSSVRLVDFGAAFGGLYDLLRDRKFSKRLLGDPRSKEFKGEIEDHAPSRHELSSREGEIASRLGHFAARGSLLQSLLLEADLRIPPVRDSKGRKHPVPVSHYESLLSSRDRTLRRNAFFAYMREVGRYDHALTQILLDHAGERHTRATLLKYPSAIDEAFDSSGMSREVLDILFRRARHLKPTFEKLIRRKARGLGVKRLAAWDRLATFGTKRRFSIAEARDLILAASAPLGPAVQDLVARAFREKWIDWRPLANKDSGAYCAGVVGSHPFIFMTYKGTIECLFTLAHEVGHAVNFALVAEAHSGQSVDMGVFAFNEVPSVLFEFLLAFHLLDAAEEMGEAVASVLINQIESTFFRQICFQDFELRLHDEAADGFENLEMEVLDDHWTACLDEWTPAAFVRTTHDELTWGYVPYLFDPLYAMQYPIAVATAANLMLRLRRGEKGLAAGIVRAFSMAGPNGRRAFAAVGIDLRRGQVYRSIEELADLILRLGRRALPKAGRRPSSRRRRTKGT